jgi:uncharacterized protein (DUF486 family)
MWFWIYFVLIMLAALFSQLAQFGHLKYAGTLSMGSAFLFAISMACIEYIFNVPANRIGLEKVGLTVNQLQIIYVSGMLLFYTLLSKYYFKTKFTWVNALALLLIGGAAAITFLV